MPFACRRFASDASIDTYHLGTAGYYWSSSSYGSNKPDSASNFTFESSNVWGIVGFYRADGHSVRCFKNSFMVPTSSWAVVQ